MANPVLVQGTPGTNDQDVLATISDAIAYNCYAVQAVTATIDVQVTVNGSDWVTVATQDASSLAPNTYLTTLSVGKVGILHGRFLGVRIRQSGATVANGTLIGG